MAKRQYEHFTKDVDFSLYDYIIIGSGIGGLTAAVFLAKAGKKVLVLEKHYVPGGFLHTFRRKKGLEWDVGVHYVGEMSHDSQMRMFFNYLTDKQQDWADVGEVYDKACFGKDEYVFPKGLDNLKAELYRSFPEEIPAINRYFELISAANVNSRLYLSHKAFPLPLRYIVGAYLYRKFHKYASQTTYDVLSQITRNEKLKAVLCAQCGDYGMSPKQGSFAAHAMVINHFIRGACYPVGGADKICKNMIDVLYRHGGRVLVKANVSEILVEKNRVTGIRVNGLLIPCSNVISNAGVNNTYHHLLKNCPTPVTATIGSIKPSHSHLCLYIGLDKTAESLSLPKSNIWFYQDYDIEDVLEKSLAQLTPEIRFAYISFPSAKDSNWNKTHRSSATIQAISVSNIALFEKFSDKPWLDRGAEYEAIKDSFTRNMLEKVYELFPQLRGHVIHTEVSTPLSTRHFMNYESGEIYGLEHSPARFALKCLSPTTSIKGLYLTGQDITLVGVSSAMLSGVLTAIHILKWSIWKNFKNMTDMHRVAEKLPE